MNNKFTWLTLALVVSCGILVFGVSRAGWFGGDAAAINDRSETSTVTTEAETTQRDQGTRPLNEVLGVDKNDMVVVGGVERPRESVEFTEPQSVDYGKKNPLPFTGLPKTVAVIANPTVKTLVDDLKKPETRRAATSSYASLEAFDLQKYQQDQQSYLNQIRPARINQTATAAEDVTALKAESEMFNRALIGESVVLRVSGTPGMPITFHTHQYGAFENELKTISLAFGDDGIATAVFKTGPGTQPGIMNVLAASPVHSGQLKFVLQVLMP